MQQEARMSDLEIKHTVARTAQYENMNGLELLKNGKTLQQFKDECATIRHKIAANNISKNVKLFAI